MPFRLRMPTDVFYKANDRVTMWHRLEHHRISGHLAPRFEDLPVFVMTTPWVDVYCGQDMTVHRARGYRHLSSLGDDERVALWDRQKGKKKAGTCAPRKCNLIRLLTASPHLEVYRGQDTERIHTPRRRRRPRKLSLCQSSCEHIQHEEKEAESSQDSVEEISLTDAESRRMLLQQDAVVARADADIALLLQLDVSADAGWFMEPTLLDEM